MTKPVWSHILALNGWTMIKTHYQLPGSLSPDYKYLQARQISHLLLNFPSQTIPDCIQHIIGVFCYNFKLEKNILASY